ncbi:MAG TPA: fibronectin type III domain-containing protein, partial [Verrucomicrobiae bacterium]|nr:fibronectin type III domain-containing protein [Verrucomicrobiae bacterium]
MSTVGNAGSARIGDDRERPNDHSSRGLILALMVLVVCWPLGVNAQAMPDPPTNLLASVISSAQVNLSWLDGSTNESGFKVERSLDGIHFSQIAQVLPNVTIYRNAGLFPGTTYFYRVRAYNAAGDSAYSNVAIGGTPALCPTAVIGWGNDSDGELEVPTGLTNVVAISGFDYHNLALKSDGTVVGWGGNCCGETMPPAGLTGVVAVAAGGFHSLALKSNGTVVGWGWNGYGQASPPAGLTGVVAIAGGDYHSLALKSDGTVVGWGDNSSDETNVPAGLTGVVAIAAGYKYSMALKSDGTVVAWGYNYYGEGSSPVGLTNAVAIAAGLFHALALRSDGTVLGWGDSYTGATSPPLDLTNAVAIGGGYLHSIAARSDGTVVAWGDDTDNDLVPPAGLTGVSAVAAGVEYSLALTTALLAPSGLTANAQSSNEVDLAWGYVLGNEDGFQVERAPDSGGSPGTWAQVATVGNNTTVYPDASLTTNTTYWYRVRAYNGCVDSPYSTEVRVVTAPPPAPLDLTASVANTNQINLSWSSSYPDETGFKIERAPDNNGGPGTWAQVATVASNVTVYADTGLSLNTIFWYRVRAYNALGDSPYSNEISGFVCDGQLVRVMQWNVEGHIGNISSNNTAEAQAIARIVNYNQPDILLFCELEDHGKAGDTAGLIDWVTNNVPYLGSQTGSTFYVSVADIGDGYERNGAISRFPVTNDITYGDGLRGLHAFQVQLNGVPPLQVYHAHLKCCSDGDSCSRKQFEAQSDADNISTWASTNATPYIFGGDWNEDESNPECTLTADYHPITTIREDGHLVEFKPTTLDGEYRTWDTSYWTTPSIRFDYILAATNRLAPVSGYVFDSRVWSNHGLYGGYYDSYDASDHYCIFADYFFPELHFGVTPTNTFASIGFPGGPFGPASQVYTISNTNSAALYWGVSHDGNWFDLSATNGVLAAGASTNIIALLNTAATALPVGDYTDEIKFSDTLAGASITRAVDLTVQDVNNLSPFQLWQMQYFGSISDPAAQPTADADGTGQDNLFKFEAGLDPTNSASVFRITSLSEQGNDLWVTWSCVAGHSYVLQGSIRTAAPGYTNVFFDISPPITAGGSGESTTNFLVPGALTRPGPADSGPITLPSGGGQSSSTQLTV